ncbi:hypothetical protein [Rheinheimera nanhaiensis]|uniref:Lipoprotein n=1 Tax=Rheinheimera nanhaiensis E407-8 TaxID=562729 RepID=I1DUZ2_9GAMM|nr:hypothetical protein [Rheinheimera nanhaiensis]GAB57870.1 hypothetical protein RNAN_0840 [Rheinheimera nanhaiensis E407-8]
MTNKKATLLFLLLSPCAAACDLNPPEPLAASMWSPLANMPVREILISNNVQLNVPAAPGVIRLTQSDNQQLIAELTSWPTDSGQIASIRAQPAVLDHDYDGIADALYAVDVQGLVWYLPLGNTGFKAPQLLADFTELQAHFRQPVQLVQSVAADAGFAGQRQSMLLLVASTAGAGDILIMLKHRHGETNLLDISKLVDRSELSAAEVQTGISDASWLQLQQSAGWYVKTQRSISAKPAVYAGVVYFTSAAVSQLNADCSLGTDALPQLHALHLHHAAAVYATRQWQIAQPDAAELALQQNAQGELEILLQNAEQQQLVLTELLAVDAACASCTKPLPTHSFPKFKRLATFQREEGAHE